MNRFVSKGLGILILLLAVLLISKISPREKSNPTDNFVVIPPPSPSYSDKATWQTYTNERYEYSFRYPLDREGHVQIPGPSADELENSSSISFWNEPSGGFPYDNSSFHVELRNLPTQKNQITEEMFQVWGLPLKEYAQKIWQDNKDSALTRPAKQVGDLVEFKLDGQTAYKFSLTDSYVSDDIAGGYSLGVDRETLFIATAYKDNKYLISTNNDKLGNEILSTFKFTK
jgi:hypothetical protein